MINTVNVIEYADDELISVRSFEDTDEGNKESEAMFKKICQEHGTTEKEIEVFMEDGYYETGTYQLTLTACDSQNYCFTTSSNELIITENQAPLVEIISP